MAAPLLIATDLRSLTSPDAFHRAALRILLADEVIAVDQDPLATQGVRVSAHNLEGGEVWAKPLQHSQDNNARRTSRARARLEEVEEVEVAVALLNRGSAPTNISVIFATHLAHLPGWGASNGDGSGAPISASVRDLWARAENGTHTSSFTAAVEPHATVLVRLRRVHTAREWQHTARPPVRGGSEVLRTI